MTNNNDCSLPNNGSIPNPENTCVVPNQDIQGALVEVLDQHESALVIGAYFLDTHSKHIGSLKYIYNKLTR